jgi:hypothetical protein
LFEEKIQAGLPEWQKRNLKETIQKVSSGLLSIIDRCQVIALFGCLLASYLVTCPYNNAAPRIPGSTGMPFNHKA